MRSERLPTRVWHTFQLYYPARGCPADCGSNQARLSSTSNVASAGITDPNCKYFRVYGPEEKLARNVISDLLGRNKGEYQKILPCSETTGLYIRYQPIYCCDHLGENTESAFPACELTAIEILVLCYQWTQTDDAMLRLVRNGWTETVLAKTVAALIPNIHWQTERGSPEPQRLDSLHCHRSICLEPTQYHRSLMQTKFFRNTQSPLKVLLHSMQS